MRYRTHLHAETYAAPIKSFLLSLLVWVAFASVAATLVSLALPNEAWAAQSKTEAETMSLSGSHVRVDSNSTASGGKEVAFYTNGSASSGFDGAASQVVLRARGTACSGDPRLKVYVDGSLKGTVSLNNSSFADYSLTLSGLSSGAHTLRISFENDYYTPQTCDRNAYLDYYTLTFSEVEAETMSLSGSHVRVDSNSTASGGKEVAFYTNGSASSGFDGAASQVVLRARGTACSGDPRLKVYVDGSLKGTVSLNNSSFADYSLTLSGLSSGAHTLRISFENDYYTPQTCDRNAYLDYYTLTLPGAPTGGGGGPSDPVLVGAGDIARCSSSGDEATAALLDGISGTVYTTGDNAYESGTATEFNNCYEPTWGRHKARTKPAPGNHEYGTPGASGYFNYFGAAAGDPSKGYYSYNLGEWHVISLNSMCEDVNVGGCGESSPMVRWLEQDLAANSEKACTLAYFHHPLFNSGTHGNATKMRPTWDALYAANAEVVLNGHDHHYERFAPQSPSGTLDTARGIREFVVGTGGASHYGIVNIQPNSQVRNSDTFGVLKLTLHPRSYDWNFVPEAGKTFTDSGTTSCH